MCPVMWLLIAAAWPQAAMYIIINDNDMVTKIMIMIIMTIYMKNMK